ncbi:hypothetical protein FO519_010910, partial [Halicephalobus sp. NKZ332]
RKSLQSADAAGIRMMTFDSVEELIKMKKFHSNPEIILRIAIDDPTAKYQLGKKFGCDPEKVAPQLLQDAINLGMNVVGIA